MYEVLYLHGHKQLHECALSLIHVRLPVQFDVVCVGFGGKRHDRV